MALTDKYMCLGCGRFWRTPHEMKFMEINCPYCGDRYYVDNVVHGVPADLGVEHEFNLPCGHSLASDIPGDLNFCCVCGTGIQVEGLTLRGWQEEELRRLGL